MTIAAPAPRSWRGAWRCCPIYRYSIPERRRRLVPCRVLMPRARPRVGCALFRSSTVMAPPPGRRSSSPARTDPAPTARGARLYSSSSASPRPWWTEPRARPRRCPSPRRRRCRCSGTASSSLVRVDEGSVVRRRFRSRLPVDPFEPDLLCCGDGRSYGIAGNPPSQVFSRPRPASAGLEDDVSATRLPIPLVSSRARGRRARCAVARSEHAHRPLRRRRSGAERAQTGVRAVRPGGPREFLPPA